MSTDPSLRKQPPLVITTRTARSIFSPVPTGGKGRRSTSSISSTRPLARPQTRPLATASRARRSATGQSTRTTSTATVGLTQFALAGPAIRATGSRTRGCLRCKRTPTGRKALSALSPGSSRHSRTWQAKGFRGTNAGGIPSFSQPHNLLVVDVDGDGLKDIITGKVFYAHPPGVDPGAADPPAFYVFRLIRGAQRAVTWEPHPVDMAVGLGNEGSPQPISTAMDGWTSR